MRKFLILLIFFLISCLSMAEDTNLINLNGFASFHSHSGLGGDVDKKLDSTTYSKLGLNLRSDFSKRCAAVGQLVAKGGNESGTHDWKITTDWAFLSCSPYNFLEVQVGRQLFPGWMVAKYKDVGIFYPYLMIPNHVYYIAPIKAFNGASVIYKSAIGAGNAEFRLFGGDEKIELAIDDGVSAAESLDSDINDIIGFDFNYSQKYIQLHGTVVHANTKAKILTNTSVGIYYGPGIPVISQRYSIDLYANHIINYSLGINLKFKTLVIMSEFVQTKSNDGTDLTASSSGMFNGNYLADAKGGYVLAGNYFSAHFPYYMYSSSIWRAGIVADKVFHHTFGYNYEFNTQVLGKISYALTKSMGSSHFTKNRQVWERYITFGVDILF